jgi:transcription factor WhiB
MQHAACRGKWEMFFPEKGESKKAEEAKRICMECPVMPECLDYYQRLSPSYGIWATQITRRGE